MKGATLVEVLVANLVLGFLMLGIFALFRLGLRYQDSGGSQNDLLQETQVATYRLYKEVSHTSRASLLVEDDVLSCLSSWGVSGTQLDGAGNLIWDHDLTYYVAQNTLFRAQRPLTTGDPRIGTPTSILNLGLSPTELRSGGTEVLTGITESLFTPTIQGTETVSVTWSFKISKSIRKTGEHSLDLSIELSPKHQ